MAKGSRMPGGVFSYDADGKMQSTKGSKHPTDISAGLEVGGKLSGSSPAVKTQSGGSTSFPSGMVAENGQANLGTKTVPILGKGVGSAPGGADGSNSIPSDVNRYDGTRAKNSISAP